MNQFLTIYTKDYAAKQIERVPPFRCESEFEDPLMEGFKNYLDIKDENPPAPKENAAKYQEKITGDEEKAKIAKMYFSDPLKIDLIEDIVTEKKITVYKKDYVYTEGGYKDPFCDIHVKLSSQQWSLPETTYGSTYRDPAIFDKDARKPMLQLRPINNLGPNEKVNEILNIETGDSEYGAIIGSLGGYIIEEQMHGKIDKVRFIA